MNKKLISALALVFAISTSAFAQDIPADIQEILKKNICLTCHKVDAKLIGPSYKDVAKKGYTAEKMVELIYNPKPENWPGYPAMAPMKQVPKDDALKVAKWINSLGGAKKGKKKA